MKYSALICLVPFITMACTQASEEYKHNKQSSIPADKQVYFICSTGYELEFKNDAVRCKRAEQIVIDAQQVFSHEQDCPSGSRVMMLESKRYCSKYLAADIAPPTLRTLR